MRVLKNLPSLNVVYDMLLDVKQELSRLADHYGPEVAQPAPVPVPVATKKRAAPRKVPEIKEKIASDI